MLKSWKQIPPRERWATLYAPLVVALFSGGVLALLVTVVGPRAIALFDDRTPRLEVVDTVLANPSRHDVRTPTLEIKLHNAGDRRAILRRLRVTVRRSLSVDACLILGGSGTLETGRYTVKLPQRPSPGLVIDGPLNQELGPDEADRFTLRFETPRAEYGRWFLYQLEIVATYHRADVPLRLGSFLVMTPQSLGRNGHRQLLASGRLARRLARLQRRNFGAGYGARTLRCMRRNRHATTRFLQSDGERAPELAAMSRYLDRTR